MTKRRKSLAVLAAREYGGELRTYLCRRLKCREDARDLLQELQMKLLKVDGAEIPNPVGYLYECARSVLADYYARPTSHSISLESAQLEGALPPADDLILELELMQDVLTYIRRLPAGTKRDVLIEIVANGRTAEEVAARYGLKEETVRDYYAREAAELKSFIRRNGAHDHD